MNAVVAECKQLEVVEVPSMDRKTVAILAASPCIRSLTLKGSRRSPCIDGDLLAQTTEAGFPALRCLRLSFCSVDDCVWMAKMMLRSPIETLDMSGCPSPTTSWQELFQQLQSAIARSSHVRLRFSDALMAGQVATTSIKAADLEPLFYFENVTSLLISFVKDLRPDNALLKKIADKWGHSLRILGFKPYDGVNLQRSKLTLDSLVLLAKSCPKLKSIHLSINAHNTSGVSIDGVRNKANLCPPCSLPPTSSQSRMIMGHGISINGCSDDSSSEEE
ncbi:hypothetical protein BD626DRAFT_54028 [Schizophyllum amplum]|uniref:F-box domain-containing protein n=1 Tax=Schizophyllum amplum TaxID=97359 RepID=A0A550CD72_9AGAR|nr:hypothetical protein BD626DRAFT_54028 [Auriculariopsis ampla]